MNFKNFKIIKENIINEIEVSDVVVAGFKLKDELDNNVWDSENILKGNIRRNLIEIASDFIESLDIEVDVLDVNITGSLANYNWSKYSDIDLHIVVDFKQVDDNYDLVKGYFDHKRIVWNLTHDIKMEGYEVEIYVEDKNEEHISTGIYSVLRDEWIIEPEVIEEIEIDVPNVKKKAASVMNQIEYVEEIIKEDPKKSLDMSDKIKKKIRTMRKAGLESDEGQYSIENIAFKVLRRNGYLKRLSDVKNMSYDISLSI
jgi:hypothetical protein